jgi:TolA-binding protein
MLVAAVLVAGAGAAWARSAEEKEFDAARRDFLQGFYERAETNFAALAATYTNWTRLPEAILYQAKARLKQGNPGGAIELLTSTQSQAGKWTSDYQFLVAEAWMQKGDDRRATQELGAFIQQFPGSTNALRAATDQAAAYKRLGEWGRVVEVLQQTNGVFWNAVRTNLADASAQRGLLLLSEALLQQPDYGAAEAALKPLAGLRLAPELDWRRQELLGHILMGSGRTNDALSNTEAMLSSAAQSGRREFQAETYALRALLLEGLGRPKEAMAAYTNNLADGFPTNYQQQALLKLTALALELKQVPAAMVTLENFVDRYSNGPAADTALLTLGELRLNHAINGLDAAQIDNLATNGPALTALMNAQASLQELARRNPDLGKGRFYLGWCFWLEQNMAECETNFQAAATLLPYSAEQATAYFKLADAQFRRTNFAAAVTNYGVVVGKFAGLPEVKTNLFEPALYQIVLAAARPAGDLTAATSAMAQLVEQFPDGYHTAPAVLLAGQALAREKNFAAAREAFSAFERMATNAANGALVPLVKLAKARTWEEEGNWTNAQREYTEWLGNYTNHQRQALAEFCRAQATSRAGDQAGALSLFTNFISKFSTDANAPLAQLWVGDYYYGAGDYRDAELSYQALGQSTNCSDPKLADEAWMWAGRAAAQQQLWNNALNHFKHLTGNKNCSAGLWIAAMCAYGDALVSQLNPNAADTNNLDHLGKALDFYSEVYARYPTNQQAVAALGSKANALAQLAWYVRENRDLATANQYYTDALNTYQQVITNRSSIEARTLAAIGQGKVLEKLAEPKTMIEAEPLLKQAQDHYLAVFRRTLVREGEEADEQWTLTGGMEAERLAEALHEWPQAINLCDELANTRYLSDKYQERKKMLQEKHSVPGAGQ